MKKNFIKKTGIVTIAAAMLFTLTPAQLVHADENGDWLGFRDNPDNNSVVTYRARRTRVGNEYCGNGGEDIIPLCRRLL